MLSALAGWGRIPSRPPKTGSSVEEKDALNALAFFSKDSPPRKTSKRHVTSPGFETHDSLAAGARKTTRADSDGEDDGNTFIFAGGGCTQGFAPARQAAGRFHARTLQRWLREVPMPFAFEPALAAKPDECL